MFVRKWNPNLALAAANNLFALAGGRFIVILLLEDILSELFVLQRKEQRLKRWKKAIPN